MIDAHRGAFEYDWRTRFNQERGLSIVGTKRMSWGEALRLFRELVRDPSSRVCVSMGNFSRLTSIEDITLMEMYDLEHHIAWAQAGGKGPKPKPFPRPWPAIVKHRTAPDKSLTQDQIIAALRAAGHTAPLPGESSMN